MVIAKMRIKDAVLRHYIPYAKMTIQERAIPDGRDGLKPVQRRILYAMHENNFYSESLAGKNGKSYKSARIVGDVMGKYHPHGDSSIYGALVSMADDYDGMLVPYIHGDGSFGRSWSDTIKPSAMRYTEASLNKIARELFDGLKEGTVEFIPNFDDTEIEPKLLPVRFPNILVNSTEGLAVGFSSYIPHYPLLSVCNATNAVISGKATCAEDLIDILGLPDFTGGGFIHSGKASALKLIKTGRATFTLSGSIITSDRVIIIKEIPYNTTIDRIEEEILKAIKDEKITDISDVINSSGFDKKKKIAQLGLRIELKSGANVKKVVAQLCRYTSLRNKISYNTKVIFGENNDTGKPIEIGIFDLLCKWIEWRQGVIQRQYTFKWKKESDRKHKLEAWEKIKDRREEVVQDVVKNTESNAKALLLSKYGLDDEQAEYLIDKKIRQLTQDKLEKALKELEDTKVLVGEYLNVINNRKSRERLIIQQIIEIRDIYSKERKCKVVDELIDSEEEEKLAEVIADMPVNIVMTKKGLVKKFLNSIDSLNANSLVEKDDKIVWDIGCNNKDTLLVFTTSGYCYKVPVHVFDNSSRTKFKDYIWKVTEKKDDGDILYVTATADYNGAFTVIYNNGKGMYVPLELVSGNRTKYMNIFEPVVGGAIACTHTKFFIITNNNAAALADITPLSMFNRRSKFRIARLSNGDRVIGVQPFEKVPGNDFLDFSMYQKGYTVKIKLPLWEEE